MQTFVSKIIMIWKPQLFWVKYQNVVLFLYSIAYSFISRNSGRDLSPLGVAIMKTSR